MKEIYQVLHSQTTTFYVIRFTCRLSYNFNAPFHPRVERARFIALIPDSKQPQVPAVKDQPHQSVLGLYFLRLWQDDCAVSHLTSSPPPNKLQAIVKTEQI